MNCSQCNRGAVFNGPIGPLCLDCTYKYQQIIDNQLANQERAINFLMDEIDMTFGIGRIGARFPERKPSVIQSAPVTMNHINIDKSIIGAVNTGTVNQLEVKMNQVSQGGNELKKFTEAVLKEDKLTKEQKEEIIQQLDFVTEQLLKSENQRNSSVVKIVSRNIVNLINFSASLMTLWDPISKLFTA
jgi:hypothetical protein